MRDPLPTWWSWLSHRPRRAILAVSFLPIQFINVVGIVLQIHQKGDRGSMISKSMQQHITSCSQDVLCYVSSSLVPGEIQCMYTWYIGLSSAIRMHGTALICSDIARNPGFLVEHQKCTQMRKAKPTCFSYCDIDRIYHESSVSNGGGFHPQSLHGVCSMQRFQFLQIIRLQGGITSAWRLRSGRKWLRFWAHKHRSQSLLHFKKYIHI